MPRVTQAVDHPLTGGQDNSSADHRSKPETFTELKNFRPDGGRLVQTPRMGNYDILNLIGAAPTSDVLLIRRVDASKFLILTRQDARLWDVTPTESEIPYIEPTIVPSGGPGETKQMLLYNLNTTDFDTREATTFEVEVVTAGTDIATPATIRWRKNGGTWSSAANLVNGMTIGSSLKLAVTTTFGFTVSDLWKWEWHDWPVDATRYVYDSVVYRDDIYISGPEQRIMRLRKVGNDWMLAQVGYRPVFGSFVRVFFNHLFIGGFWQSGATLAPTADAEDRYTIGWSHLDDPDEFYSTAINEADEYVLPYAGKADLSFLGITAMEQHGEYLYTYTPDQIFATMYVGLPLVMRTVSVTDQVGCAARNALVNTPYGHFFMSRGDFHYFNPAEGLPQSIGAPIRDAFFAEVDYDLGAFALQIWTYYDADRKEVVWTYKNTSNQQKQLVYCIESRTWFFRETPPIFSSSEAGLALTQRIYGGANSLLYVDDLNESYEPHAAEMGGISYAVPTATKHLTDYGDPRINKVLQHSFLDASWEACDGLRVDVGVVDYANQTPSMVAGDAVWTQTKPEKQINHRLKGRLFKAKLTATGTEANRVIINRWADVVEVLGAPTT